jgi:hypothetical protein
MAASQAVPIEHGTSRIGRWLRARRLRVALWAAVVEGLLVVLHVIPWSIAIIAAAAIILVYFSAASRLRSDTARQIAWMAAVSQALVALVPVLLIIVSTVAIIMVAALAVVALVLLFARG